MRYHLAALTLLAIPPLMNVLAAPAPPISRILDVGPPPKGCSAEKHRDMAISNLIDGMSPYVWDDPEVRKLKSVVEQKVNYSWVMKNIQVEPYGERRLRLTFRAGNDAEQAIIVNSLLCVYLRLNAEKRQRLESRLREIEEGVPQLIKIIESGKDPRQNERNREELKRSQIDIPKRRAEVARLKQIAVIRWAQ